ncbi:hypothetical protein KY290_033598 [Solanum tuberosum]|uniref:Uncharacterized protein n=1 Tax=Solanum tuberosum TaxID=4113 RepID=A0ABQ7U4D6_SOLTU|nr:hypothetical protein KY289_032969 [Solanum tuberosum]KAH0649258.1 hypothetical protein KY285_034506 [Solanum tuberosum]KAH0740555.1 hypothetical protein KY290_033598 [Solanum tuberosum]
MVYFKDLTSPSSNSQYLVISDHKSSEVETKLLIEKPLGGQYASLWPYLGELPGLDDWILEYNSRPPKAWTHYLLTGGPVDPLMTTFSGEGATSVELVFQTRSSDLPMKKYRKGKFSTQTHCWKKVRPPPDMSKAIDLHVVDTTDNIISSSWTLTAIKEPGNVNVLETKPQDSAESVERPNSRKYFLIPRTVQTVTYIYHERTMANVKINSPKNPATS